MKIINKIIIIISLVFVFLFLVSSISCIILFSNKIILQVENHNLKNESVRDSSLIYEKDSIIRDYANINLKISQKLSESSKLERQLQADTSYTNISSKYN